MEAQLFASKDGQSDSLLDGHVQKGSSRAGYPVTALIVSFNSGALEV